MAGPPASGPLIHAKAALGDEGRHLLGRAHPLSAGLDLEIWWLAPGSAHTAISEDCESLLVVLGGNCDVAVPSGERWGSLGERGDVFAGAATSVYLPPPTSVEVASENGAEVAVVRAPADPGGRAYVIRPEDVRRDTRGEGSWKREVHTILDATRPAHRLIVGETYNAPGGWSSYPPHKHDQHRPPDEARLQEIYHYRFQPEQGFGVQRVYSRERGIDELLLVEHGDTVLIPFGYHPVVAAPGYSLYYFWALAGEGRELRLQEDPEHAWVARPA